VYQKTRLATERACGVIFPSWLREESLLIVIDVGIDESKSGSLLVVSAIVGKTSTMRKLDSEWKREITTAGIDYFHAKEHWNLKSKAYHGISTTERKALLDRLIVHLHHRFLFGASTIINETEYRQTTSERFRSQYGSPYGWGFTARRSFGLVGEVFAREPLGLSSSTSSERRVCCH
jgi:hypothetical protein